MTYRKLDLGVENSDQTLADFRMFISCPTQQQSLGLTPSHNIQSDERTIFYLL